MELGGGSGISMKMVEGSLCLGKGCGGFICSGVMAIYKEGLQLYFSFVTMEVLRGSEIV